MADVEEKPQKKPRGKLSRKLLYFVLPAVIIPTVLLLIIFKGADLGQSAADAKAQAAAEAAREKEMSARVQNPASAAQRDASKALAAEQIVKNKEKSTLPPPGVLPPPPAVPSPQELEALSKEQRLRELERSRAAVSKGLSASERTSALGSSKGKGNDFLVYSAPVPNKPLDHAAQGVASVATVESKKKPAQEPFIADHNKEVKDATGIKVARRVRGRYWLAPGTIVRAVLLGAINTQIPGEITAQVTDPIYDSRYGKYLVIPAGSRLVGEYSSKVSDGQERVMVAFKSLVTPAGGVVDLGGSYASDALGRSGVAGDLHTHFWQRMGVAVLYAFEAVGMDRLSNSQTTVSMNGASATTNNASQAAGIIANAANQDPRLRPIAPNITVQEGQQVSLITVTSIEIPPVANKR